MKNYEQKLQRDEQKDQKHQNIILNIKQHHLHQMIKQNPKKRTGASRPEHNADHKNEQTPDNRPKAEAKNGLSPNKNLPPFPTGEKSIWKSR